MRPGRHDPFSPEDERLGRAFDRRLMARLLRYGLPYRGWMAAAVALILVTTGLDLAGPFIVRWIIDGPLGGVLGGGAAGGSPVSPALSTAALHALYGAVGIYLGMIALELFLRYLQGMTMSSIGQRVMHDLRIKVFSHLQRMPVAYFDRNPVGRLTTRVTNDIEALNQLFTSGVVNFIADLLVLCGVSCGLVWVNSRLAAVTLAVLPPLLLVTFVFRRAAQRSYREQRGHLAHLNGFTQESLQGMSVIQLFGREPENGRRLREINRRYLNAFQRTVLYYSLYFPVVEIIGALVLATILWQGGVGLRAGTITAGDFYLFWRFLGKFMSPVRDMAERYNVLQAAMAAGERVFKVLDGPVGPQEAPPETEAAPLAPLKGEVEFRDIWFSYEKDNPEGRYAARGVSFTVRAGETVAIVGATGAGKSTLVNLLTRFYLPQSGSILIDGRDAGDYPVHQLRRRIAVVLQDPFLFSRSIRENLRLGRPEVPDELILAAARRTHAERVIAEIPGGLDAVLGERGAGLSSGEKQLLAFARALVQDPDILILDEATAYVDGLTEELVQGAVRELLSGRTSIVIAHRLSTIRQASRIVVLHKGEVREVGTQEELLQKRGIYYRLHRLQSDPAAAPGVLDGPAAAPPAEEPEPAQGGPGGGSAGEWGKEEEPDGAETRR
jgi:ATP-binding cassette subfamily B multidrug efflux pump